MKIEWRKVTWYSKAIALGLFVLLPFFGFWFGASYGAARQRAEDVFAVSPAAAPVNALPAYYENTAAWQTDGNFSGWSIAYPIDFPTTDNYRPASIPNWRQGTPGGSGIQMFRLTIPKVFEPQTNFSDAALTVGMSSSSAAVAQCLVPESTYRPQPTSTVDLNSIPFTVFHFSDVGAGNLYDTTSYRTIHAGACWAVEYTIHSAQLGNYPSSYGLRQFDAAKLQDVLNRIVGTFKFD